MKFLRTYPEWPDVVPAYDCRDEMKQGFLQQEEPFFIPEAEVAGLAGKEERVKGYRVKTTFSPVREGEKKTKREAVAKVILGAIRRKKDKEGDEI